MAEVDENSSILKKSVIPNLLNEGFEPTFITEVEDDDFITKRRSKNLQDDAEAFEDAQHLINNEENCDKRIKFKSSIDFRKTLGKRDALKKSSKFRDFVINWLTTYPTTPIWDM